jgi:hypothetical protein
MYEPTIYDYSSVRICLNANIHTFLFINRWCKAKKPSVMRGRGFFRNCTKSTLIVWYFVSNKPYFIEQKRGKKKDVIFLVLGKLLKRWMPWWSACGSVSPSPSLQTVSSLYTT